MADATLIIGVFGVVASLSAIGVTITLFILSGLKEDLKTHAASASKSSTALWDSLNSTRSDFSDYKEHIAMNYPQEDRVNEKLDVNKQFLNQALSGITHRLTKLESDSDKTLRAVETMSENQQKDMRTVILAIEAMKGGTSNDSSSRPQS